MKKEFDEMDERCNPQCMLNQEPGYVIYSAVGSFYAPMLVMMFFNWRIYQTAKKTTKAIRQGWTRVKGIKLQIQKKYKKKARRTFFLFGNMYILHIDRGFFSDQADSFLLFILPKIQSVEIWVSIAS